MPQRDAIHNIIRQALIKEGWEITDDTQNRYALMQVGWDRGRRVRGNLIYVTLSSGGDNGARKLLNQAFWLVTLPQKFNLLTGLLTMSRLTFSLKQP